ncbi:DUF1254 domain-containing protein [Microbulbifer thermotolerans]|uniref:DUF1254 domain-containing protein n=2 Tax=Microbulbifer thermotolerans TaxID=252514 RepID=A0AB35HVQ1_MICTH|nr:DUF1254 domain-containing protein [Microbulbifer thermotolerans]MCX2801612.1 DUF1254 domain-containing protein [Microbulbifer thermotolerans]MCX2833288.1 DUF1254 domain-containing protein [Microbulbifer thermotolerans]MCX2841018.1 DUF1254 domain-containing protein [Microbulbifer thermotolerans]
MKNARFPGRNLALAVALVCAALGPIHLFAQSLSADEAKSIAVDAYIYGYPLVTMEMTRRVMTNVATPEGSRAPMGQFARLREYPTAAFRDVTTPNADTLYTIAWIDVGREPWILQLPDTHGRYYLFPMLDAWTNVFKAPGKRTTGTGAQTYAITGPGWKGALPEGITPYESPTAIVWLLGRIYSSGTPEDYAKVHKIQDEISIVPLSAYGKNYTPPRAQVNPTIDMKTPVRTQVNRMGTSDFFNLLAKLMKDNPPAATDAPMIAKMAKLGITPGEPFALDKLAPDIQEALRDVPKVAFEKILAHFKSAGREINGWMVTTETGRYGTDYLQRAFITAMGLGANLPQDAVYPSSSQDAEGKPFSGANQYVMHFAKGQMPPVNGFWSLTMYNEQNFFVDNPLHRYTLSPRDRLKKNPDGSLDLYIQHENPGPEKASNWLPAPKGKFNLVLRLYWPAEKPPSVIDGSWNPPPVKKVK